VPGGSLSLSIEVVSREREVGQVILQVLTLALSAAPANWASFAVHLFWGPGS